MYNGTSYTRTETIELPKPTPSFRIMVTKMAGDMRFIGTFALIYGALCSLTIVGAVVGVPLIIAGLRLRESSDSFQLFKNSYSFESLRRGFENQAKFFSINRALIILSLVLMLLYFIVMAVLIYKGLAG